MTYHTLKSKVYPAGPEAEMQPIIGALSAEGIFTRTVDSRGIAYHSPALDTAIPALRKGVPQFVARNGFCIPLIPSIVTVCLDFFNTLIPRWFRRTYVAVLYIVRSS
jgi:hypothetical protein